MTTGSEDADVADTDWTQQCRSEYHAMCGTSVTGMGSQALLHNSKLHSLVRVTTDDSLSKAFVRRHSLIRMKHIQTRFCIHM